MLAGLFPTPWLSTLESDPFAFCIPHIREQHRPRHSFLTTLPCRKNSLCLWKSLRDSANTLYGKGLTPPTRKLCFISFLGHLVAANRSRVPGRRLMRTGPAATHPHGRGRRLQGSRSCRDRSRQRAGGSSILQSLHLQVLTSFPRYSATLNLSGALLMDEDRRFSNWLWSAYQFQGKQSS